MWSGLPKFLGAALNPRPYYTCRAWLPTFDGWGLGSSSAHKCHCDNAHKQLTVCWRSQELWLSMASKGLLVVASCSPTPGVVLTALGKQDSELSLRECVGCPAHAIHNLVSIPVVSPHNTKLSGLVTSETSPSQNRRAWGRG